MSIFDENNEEISLLQAARERNAERLRQARSRNSLIQKQQNLANIAKMAEVGSNVLNKFEEERKENIDSNWFNTFNEKGITDPTEILINDSLNQTQSLPDKVDSFFESGAETLRSMAEGASRFIESRTAAENWDTLTNKDSVENIFGTKNILNDNQQKIVQDELQRRNSLDSINKEIAELEKNRELGIVSDSDLDTEISILKNKQMEIAIPSKEIQELQKIDNELYEGRITKYLDDAPQYDSSIITDTLRNDKTLTNISADVKSRIDGFNNQQDLINNPEYVKSNENLQNLLSKEDRNINENLELTKEFTLTTTQVVKSYIANADSDTLVKDTGQLLPFIVGGVYSNIGKGVSALSNGNRILNSAGKFLDVLGKANLPLLTAADSMRVYEGLENKIRIEEGREPTEDEKQLWQPV